MVKIGKQEFQSEDLFFHEDSTSCLNEYRIDGVLLGGILHYLPSPYTFLASLITKSFDYIILDRTPFLRGSGDRIFIQEVPASIYNASYPCRALDFDRCTTMINKYYDIIDIILALEGSINAMYFVGIIATLKNSNSAE
jgi:putative methyltransferase (TIGR04325 family)